MQQQEPAVGAVKRRIPDATATTICGLDPGMHTDGHLCCPESFSLGVRLNGWLGRSTGTERIACCDFSQLGFQLGAGCVNTSMAVFAMSFNTLALPQRLASHDEHALPSWQYTVASLCL